MYENEKDSEYWDSLKKWVSEKHKDQMYGDKEYMYHINMVTGVAQEYLDLNNVDDVKLLIALYCHDLMEDQGVTKEELTDKFGSDVAEMVSAVSGDGNTRMERTLDTIKKLNEKPNAINVKIVDRFCNMKCARVENKQKLMKMYFSEVGLYEELFKKALPAFQNLFNEELELYKSVFDSENKKEEKFKLR